MSSVRVIADARRELLDTVAWYETQRQHLGTEFSQAIAEALRKIEERPATWPLIGSAGLRRYIVRRFPYTVIYGIDGDQAVVVAIAHMKQKPGYWQGRVHKMKRPARRAR
jgi:hypothetical protein